MEPIGVHHVAVNVTDVEAAVEFYTAVLGGRVRDDRPDLGIGGAWIDLGEAQVHLVELPVPPSMGQHFAVRVDDLDAAVVELRAGGYDVADPSQVGAGLQTFLTDPSGNTVELHQVLEGL
ncbi:MAG TPA: VOC family protein [Microthrixaceae bacterium]|nr:VOC family protein [Microthrixaceae bacterium]HMV74444.1 VOC family protein [Microthrixaceae bacterium]HMX06014.1 VOC family protein [Microthrixaceae bacterium]HMX64658.1 VOC family protein [Microthrixaceae bacterium]HMY86066.1 VOC family protein [Microthrixaceae bacterium]